MGWIKDLGNILFPTKEQQRQKRIDEAVAEDLEMDEIIRIVDEKKAKAKAAAAEMTTIRPINFEIQDDWAVEVIIDGKKIEIQNLKTRALSMLVNHILKETKQRWVG